ncbi:MAG: lipid-binding SYLF domain-containing protein [Acidobacteria bacterium]|nr:lipid-binding SYLF domain-containing protein [Acidobacteriota bacterium]
MKPLLLSLLIAALSGTSAVAQKDKGKELRDAVNKVSDASAAIDAIMRAKDKGIPQDLLNKAEAVVIFPSVLKAAFIIGGQGGSGVAIKRVANGWSAPAFLKLGGGSVGLQIGGSKTDLILLIMNDSGLKRLLDDKFEIGGEASVAAGLVGRTAAASTTTTLHAEILTYSRSKGLFAGVSLKGAVISHDDDRNILLYDKNASQILGVPPVLNKDAPSGLGKLADTLATYSK